MNRLIDDFVGKFNAKLELDERLIKRKQNRLFLVTLGLKPLIPESFFYAGSYIGKVKRNSFFPSFPFLALLAECDTSNKVTVDEKTEWLFICGRDVFKQGILSATGSLREHEYTLILNQHGECLGFGALTSDLHKESRKRAVSVRNVSDLGDFLRREARKHVEDIS